MPSMDGREFTLLGFGVSAGGQTADAGCPHADSQVLTNVATARGLENYLPID
jgi:hypothetical protein